HGARVGPHRPAPTAQEEVNGAPMGKNDSKSALLLVLVLGGLLAGVLLVGCVGVGAYLIFGRGGRSSPGNQTTPMTQADLDKVQALMTLAEVEGVLGKGRQVRYHEIGIMPAGGDDPNCTWYAWGPEDDSLVVGFEPGKSGTQRVVVSFLLQ